MNATSDVTINVKQTYVGDWLLETAVLDKICATFSSPYGNDYRGGDLVNPNNILTGFTPDKPVFAKLPDGSYGLFDSRLQLAKTCQPQPPNMIQINYVGITTKY